ncbi:MAG: rhodanese-like domain-containing protein [bacterium]|jgi:rhodanese-related sulfurtransferase|nr:rhodanese-like domain-containing protein [bacterium]
MSFVSRLRGRLPRRPRSAGPAEATALIEEGALLLDVRDRTEWNAGHARVARHVPLAQLPSHMDSLPEGQLVITVCRSGLRSSRAARLLADHGHEVVNLTGGMIAWARAGLPVVDRDSRPGRVV